MQTRVQPMASRFSPGETRPPRGRSWARSSPPSKSAPTTDATYRSSALAAALEELATLIDDDSLTNWNDEPSRTQDDVIVTLEAAATSAASKLNNGS
jgi:hypothetical protein